MVLYFKNSRGVLREIAKIDDMLTDGEIFAAAMTEIEAFCKGHSFAIYYTRVWNAPHNNTQATIFDVGSHTEFFYLIPSINIESLHDSESEEHK